MNTLLIGDIHPEAEKLLQKSTTLRKITPEEFAKNGCSDAEAVILRTFTSLQKKELQKFPQLKYVVSCSVGLDNIDLGELRNRNMQLIHCPGSNANSVAEHTLYLLLSLFREDTNKPFKELKNKTVGIIGFGAIGKLVAKKLLGFEARVLAFDVIEQHPQILKELRVEMKNFDDVVQQADILTVHVPLLRQTEKLINNRVFEKMKQHSFFINTSRAEVVDEDALLSYQNKFRGIALDVYSEKLKAQLSGNVIFTDHIAAQGEDSFREMCLQPIQLFLEKIQVLLPFAKNI